MYDLKGRRIGKYEIERPLGRGGMATVYLGRDTALNRPVAIKVLDPATTAEPGAVQRFQREAVLAANLEHPNIMPVYDVREDDGLWYLTMRYVPGESLREILVRQGSLPLDRIVAILKPAAAALDYAHSHGVIHRDVKPGNILVEPDGHVVLTDFGIARGAADMQLTRAGQVMGTADYLAPEQIRGEGATAASDLYSFGIVLYEMLTGRTPFTGESAAEVLYKQVHTPPPPLRTLRPDLPAALQPTLDRILHKTPALRYTTAAEMVQALSGVARQEPDRSRRVPQPPPTERIVLAPASVALNRQTPEYAAPAAPVAAPVPRAVTPAAARGVTPLAPPRRFHIRTLLILCAGLLILLGGAAAVMGVLRSRPGGSGGGISGGTPTYTPAFTAPAAVAYAGPRRDAAGSGADLHANRAQRAPTVDGKLDDWTGASTWPAAYRVTDLPGATGPADLSAQFLIGYDATNFYLGAVVTDNIHVQNAKTRGTELWKGDDIELWFDTNLAGDFSLDPGNQGTLKDDFQLGFSPGDFAGLAAESVMFVPKGADAAGLGIQVAATPRAPAGYTLEARVPWAALHMAAPSGGAIGFCASAGDNDVRNTAQQQHMVSTCRRMKWNQPTTFANLFW
ncbi:MAG TPA: protein kinase [Chloroflexia bacterium]|nr:protein kinase [Chloroflexia bacterium]